MAAEDLLRILFEAKTGKNWDALCDAFPFHGEFTEKLKLAPSCCPAFLQLLIDAATTPDCRYPNYYSIITEDSSDGRPTSRLGIFAKPGEIMPLPSFLRKTFGSVPGAKEIFDAFIDSTEIAYSTAVPRP